jgi:5-hydroxyisourate hydrolase
MSGISTHVLDTARGLPAAGVTVTLSVQAGGGAWTGLARAATDGDGRIARFLPAQPAIAPGSMCRLRFDVGEYFAAQGVDAFYPYVEITFTLRDDRHHHVPLLVSPFGYTTYRGS